MQLYIALGNHQTPSLTGIPVSIQRFHTVGFGVTGKTPGQ